MLSDASKRSIYDQHGHAGIDAARQGGHGGAEHFSDIFGDVFGDIFGGARRGGGRSQVYRGADLRYATELDLAEAVFGHTLEIDLTKLVECETCHGNGAAKGSSAGHLRDLRRFGPGARLAGIFHVAADLPALPRLGAHRAQPLRHLPGAGPGAQAQEARRQDPAGRGHRAIGCGSTGEGEAGRNGGPPGDLYVEVQVREHPIFERDGPHLSCEVPLSFATAALGGTVDVPTLEGEVSLKVPAESQSGRVFRLARQGHQAGARRRAGRSVLPGDGGDPGQAFHRAARAAAAPG